MSFQPRTTPSTNSLTPSNQVDLKVIILGNGRVGKTSFLNRYINNEFADTISTIGASFALKRWKSFYLGIWDTAGQQKFARISSLYSRGAQAAILAFDLGDRESFETLPAYLEFLKDADPDCYLVLIGTKKDLIGDGRPRQVSEEEAKAFARQHHAPYFETSAKLNVNVAAVFDTIGHHCFAGRIPAEAVGAEEEQAERRISETAAPDRACCTIF